jgi:DNA helicase HerA-like ATPase
VTPARTDAAAVAALQVHLGLVAEEVSLDVAPGTLPGDLNPWLLDLCAARVDELGHWERVPRPHDWENLLPLLRPGEELLWILDYRRREGAGAREQFTIRLALKLNRPQLADRGELAAREARFRAVLGHFRRQAFPESAIAELGPAEAFAAIAGVDHGATFCVTGIPSPKDQSDEQDFEARSGERAAFQSLNDVVESFLHLPAFRLVFVVGRVGEAALAEEFGRVTQLRNHIHPLVKAQVAAAEQVALSWQGNTSKADTSGASRQESDSVFARIGRGLAGLFVGSRPDGTMSGFLWDRAPAGRNWSTTATRSEGWSQQTSSGETRTIEHLDSALELVDQSLGRYAENLYAARATGAYRAACLVQVSPEHIEMLAGAVRGVLSGSRSKDRPMAAFAVRGDAGLLLRSNQPVLDGLAPAAPILTDLQACRYLLLPEAELPGVRMHRGVFLGRNAAPEAPAPGDARRSRRVRLGRFAFTAERDSRGYVEIDERDLYSHVLVTGTTGSGKTRRVLKILNDLEHLGDDIRVVVFETAKRTYRRELGRFPDRPPRVYTLGDATGRPLRVNPFYFEPGTSLKRHVSVLSDALSELMPTEALIGPKMREAVERAYVGAGWDIETGRSDRAPRYPSVLDFTVELRRIAASLTYGAEVNANYRGALEGRARIFLDPTYQDIFSHEGDVPIEELFAEDTIVEMESLPPGEFNIPGFLLAILLERIRSHQARTAGARRGWLLVVEEAHNVLARELESRRDAAESNGGRTLLQQVVRLLQEGREMRVGVMVVDQSPAMLARAVVKNTNTKIVMRLEDGEEIAEMGRSLGLDEEQATDLGSLRRGEAIVRTSYMSLPVKSSAYDDDELPISRAPDDGPRAEAPSYLALERAWASLFAGVGPAPEERWLASIMEAARGSRALVRFAGEKVLLGLERHVRIDEDVLAFARHEHARAQQRLAAAELLAVERRVLAALTDADLPEGTPSALAVRLAADALGKAWTDPLARLARARTRDWAASAAAFRDFASSHDGPWGPTVRLRCWHAMATDHPAVAAAARVPFEPLDLWSAAVTLLDALGLDVADDAPARAIARVLVRQVAPANSGALEAWLDG